MSWLRIDDTMMENPKIEALTDRQLRVWLRLLCYCARQRNGGELPPTRTQRAQLVPGLTPTLIAKLANLGLIDIQDSSQNGPGFVADSSQIRPRFVADSAQIQPGSVAEHATDWSYFVHDFAHYNPPDPTAQSRMQRYRDRNATVTNTVTPTVTKTVTRARDNPYPSQPVTEKDKNVVENPSTYAVTREHDDEEPGSNGTTNNQPEPTEGGTF